jgi:hypothetical protein
MIETPIRDGMPRRDLAPLLTRSIGIDTRWLYTAIPIKSEATFVCYDPVLIREGLIVHSRADPPSLHRCLYPRPSRSVPRRQWRPTTLFQNRSMHGALAINNWSPRLWVLYLCANKETADKLIARSR